MQLKQFFLFCIFFPPKSWCTYVPMCESLKQLISYLYSHVYKYGRTNCSFHISSEQERETFKNLKGKPVFFSMAATNFPKKLALIMVITVMVMLVLEPQHVECAFAVPLNPCTVPECIAQCKKILHAKFMSASCTTGSQGNLCICLGWNRHITTVCFILYICLSLIKWNHSLSWFI